MKTKSIIKSLLLAAVVAAGLPTTAQQQAPMELAGASKANYRGEYKQGEVIVKFKDDAGVTVKVAKHGKRLMTTSVTSLDSKLQAIGLNTAEQLMPLTGAKKLSLNKAPRRGPSGKIVPEPDLSRLYLMTFKETPEKPMKDVVEQLKQIDQVEYAYPNYYVYAQSDGEASEADPMRTEQWYLDAIKLPQLWQMPKLEGAKRPVIAIIDTGVDITHPDLADNIWTNSAEASGATAEDDDQNGFVDDLHGWNFVQHNAVMEDRNGHGTHCAGIAAAVGNNGIGIAGANPDALIMPVTVMEPDGVGTAAVIIQGIDYAVANGADVLSMSFGSSSPWGYDIYQKAYQTAILAGAAGNAGQSIYRPGSPSGLSFPGAFDIVLGVQASNEQNTQTGFSNFDPDGPYYVNSDWYGSDWWNYEIWAPGQNILSTYPGGTYKSMNGTSMATPLVAGAISRLLQTKEPEYYRDVWIGDIVAAKAQDSIIVMDDYRSGTEYATSIFDAMAAYNFDYSNRKARLSIPLVEIDDTEGGDGDGIIDAGETIKLWPTLRSEWGLANNVTFSIMANPLYESASNVEVLENDVDFGYSLNRASLRSKNPLVIKVAEDVDDNHILKLRITATCDNIINDVEQDVEFKVENIAELQSVITEDMTLYPDKHYVVKKSIAIPQGVTLTIKPGTRLEFNEGCYIKSEGKIIANGKPDSLIVFTSHDPEKTWGGIRSHSGSSRPVDWNNYIYTNADTTLFTLDPTNATPIRLNQWSFKRYAPQASQEIKIHLTSYLTDFHKDLWEIGDYIYMNDKQNLMIDPEFITQPVLHMLSDVRDSLASYSIEPSEACPNTIYLTVYPGYHNKFYLMENPCDTLSYCVMENYKYESSSPKLHLNDCILINHNKNSYNTVGLNNNYIFQNSREGFSGYRNNFINTKNRHSYVEPQLKYSNFSFYQIHNNLNWSYKTLKSSNIIYSGRGAYTDHNGQRFFYIDYIVGTNGGITTDHAELPSWLGTSKESIIRPYVYDAQNPNVDCFTTVDLSNMPTRPIRETHGIVWKVVVDGYDAQDDFDEMPPLGVGRHKFEVYYNRDDMDTNFAPTITMGTYEPYTQIPINEEGSWSVKDGVSVYTAYLNVNGKLSADGLNRIVVTGGKDHDHFDIPDERWRFNVLVQAAGSMATGFAAEPGLGKVKLTWNNENNDFEDAMGFNVYRFQLNANNDTINKVRINETIIDVEDTEYTDFGVTAGETYYYYYKVMSTDLKEYDISNVVAATPLTSIKGDANGSMSVNVADVVSIVAYLSQQDPQPFIFDAADVNEDGNINILDIVGVINIIAHPEAGTMAMTDESVVYTIEDGILYVNSPVALGGVQVTVKAATDTQVRTLEALEPMERMWIQVDETTRMLLSYSMGGKTIPAGKVALLDLNSAELTDLVLSDSRGNELLLVNGEVPTLIGDITADTAARGGVYDLMGRKVADSAAAIKRLQPGIYIVNGKKIVVK